MKKTVVIMTISKGAALFYASQLKKIFENYIEIITYNMEEGDFKYITDADLYLIGTTSSEIFDYSIGCIPENKQIVIIDITFTKDTINKIKAIPKGTKVLLVNLSNKMANETVTDLYRAGINDVEFFPIGPEEKHIPKLKIAVTPAEARFVPSFVKNIIDIGHRTLTANTIIETAFKLNLSHLLETDNFKSYINNLAVSNYTIESLQMKSDKMESLFEILLNVIDIGIIGIDLDNIVFAFNDASERILGESRDDVIGKSSSKCLSCLPLNYLKDNIARPQSKLITVKNNLISIATTPIIHGNKHLGYFATVQKFSEEEEKQNRLRLQLLHKGHTAKYEFDDIKGECPQILKAKNVAKRMSKSNASILLTGESGTGKELFAHSIHNYSDRCNEPFVAINCAALPDNLLESELFGYSDGSFTGAKKGGKIGLFEHAHKGTLFLDEIEGMSQNLQIKLLRVLQEKEIMRLGDGRIINVDVRIVAASNENIKKMVKEGSFRKDLYYRINTLPIDISPLRDRGNDILLIFEHIKQSINATFETDNEVKRAFLNYAWDGNIRELRNIIEFLSFTDKKIITINDLPDILFEDDITEEIEDKCEIEKHLRIIAGKKYETYIYVLNEISKISSKGVNVGRKSLVEILKNTEFELSEQEIRGVIQNLEKVGLVQSFRGRKGTVLTEKSKYFIKI